MFKLILVQKCLDTNHTLFFIEKLFNVFLKPVPTPIISMKSMNFGTIQIYTYNNNNNNNKTAKTPS
jgi:hypothetical protein